MNKKPVGPALRKRQLAKDLAALRAAAGLDLTEAGDRLGVDRTQISHYESLRNPRVPPFAHLKVLLDVYGASGHFDELNELRMTANKRGWWDIPGLTRSLKLYLGLEDDAIEMQRLALEIVPGILQKESYVRSILELHRTSPEDTELAVSTRVRRRTRVETGELKLSVILSQGVLSRASYMGQAGMDQLRQLREDVDLPGLTLRILPFSVGAHRGMISGFTLLRFPEGVLDPVVLHEQATGNTVSEDRRVVDELGETYQDLLGCALDQRDTAEELDSFIDGAKEFMNVQC